MVQAAEFDPEPLNVKNLRIRDIYALTYTGKSGVAKKPKLLKNTGSYEQ
jgi:hypothetical protein